MCETKTVLVSVCLTLLVRASCCIYWVYPEKNWDNTAKSKFKILAKMSTRSIV